MGIDLCAWSRGGLGSRGACLTSPSLHLPESGNRDTLRRVRSDTVPPRSGAGGGKFEVIKAGSSIITTDMTKGAKVERLFREL